MTGALITRHALRADCEDEMKRTEWYPGSVKPVRTGVYEKNIGGRYKYQHWNGIFWGGWSEDQFFAEKGKNYKSSDQSSPWRGLTTENWK